MHQGTAKWMLLLNNWCITSIIAVPEFLISSLDRDTASNVVGHVMNMSSIKVNALSLVLDKFTNRYKKKDKSCEVDSKGSEYKYRLYTGKRFKPVFSKSKTVPDAGHCPLVYR